ncbi:MAG: sortase [Actinomycetota bacterium]|nr:sortase [Actinomycetota bacterium]
MRLVVSTVALLAAGCAAGPEPGSAPPTPEPRVAAPSSPEADPDGIAAEAPAAPAPPPYTVSDGRPRDAVLSIPQLELRDLQVVAYRGFTDDAPGTEIQNDGRAASPYGPRGGVGPGGIGNYQVTAHRTSSTRAFEFLPQLRRGARVVVRVGGVDYVYRVTTTRETSFRSARSLREQRAAVPGHPGRQARRAMITLSTCATLEDHAEGNYWADEFDNPEHRIDKIGVLIASRESR